LSIDFRLHTPSSARIASPFKPAFRFGGLPARTVAPGQVYRITLTNTLTKRKPMGDARGILAAHPELTSGPARINY